MLYSYAGGFVDPRGKLLARSFDLLGNIIIYSISHYLLLTAVELRGNAPLQLPCTIIPATYLYSFTKRKKKNRIICIQTHAHQVTFHPMSPALFSCHWTVLLPSKLLHLFGTLWGHFIREILRNVQAHSKLVDPACTSTNYIISCLANMFGKPSLLNCPPLDVTFWNVKSIRVQDLALVLFSH